MRYVLAVSATTTTVTPTFGRICGPGRDEDDSNMVHIVGIPVAVTPR
jgi:hypothetical protein